MMDHEEAFELLPAYVDQELGVADALAVERHLRLCVPCAAQLAEQEAMHARLRAEGTRYRAPAALVQRIALDARAQPRAGMFARLQDRAGSGLDVPMRSLHGWGAAALAVSVLALLWSAGLYLALPSGAQRLTAELVASHVRSLQVAHLSDVASSDKHTVKPWFNGKLDFSPSVVDLAAQGFALEGGRLDYLDGRPVAVIVYRHRQHPINLYIWPGAVSDTPPRDQDRQGFHLVGWSSGAMNYWAVSDLATNELEAFVALLRAQP